MRWWLLFTATCLLAAGCSQSPGEPETDLQAVAQPAVEEAEAEPASDMPEEPVDQFDFEAAIGGVARIEAEVCDGGSVGTGFMIDERHIVTVAHVIEGATSILVEVNGDLAEAVTVGFDKERDIALLRSDIPLGDQTFELQEFDYTTGDQIFAIGFPRGLDASLTTGVISNREVEFDFMPFSRFIQVDAPLNPGNSGGPVFNEAGDVIGIVDWGLSESQGLNFAIAVSSVDRVIETWTENSTVPNGTCEAAGDDGDSVSTNDEVAEAPLPRLPSASWDEAPVLPPDSLSAVAYRWGDSGDWCSMIAPTGHDGTGEEWQVEFFGSFRTGNSDFEILGHGTEIGIQLWGLEETEILDYFEPGVTEQYFEGGSVLRSIGDSRLIAIPGEECFYEISLREWNMASLSNFFGSLQRIQTTGLSPNTSIELGWPGKHVIPTVGGETFPHPLSVLGYEPDGPPVREDFRLFSGVVMSSWPHPAGMNRCLSTYWTARWRSLNDQLLIESLLGPYYLAYEISGMTEEDLYGPVPEEWRSPVPSTSGFISGYTCDTPAFQIVPGQDASLGNLADLVVEVQYWRPAP